MGLDVSHDCWHGSYSAFHRWRSKLAEVSEKPPLDSMEGFKGKTAWSSLKPDVLNILLDHSDCDGTIPYESCKPLADRLTELLPLLDGDGGGHIGSYRDKTQTFIDGLLLADSLHEDVEFG